MPKFVSVVCACGSKFDREVKQGRPQVWCPACREKPFYERISTGAAKQIAAERAVAVVNDEAEVEEVEADAMTTWRAKVEEAVAAQYAVHKDRIATLIAEGLSSHEAANIASDLINAPALAAVYKSVGTRPKIAKDDPS